MEKCDIVQVKISFIIPVYNAEKYLDKCISSICMIKNKDIEIILINDGSKDDSLGICMKYASLDKRITVIDQCNKGVSSARNEGLKKAKGEWICFVDADDWLDEKFEDNMFPELDSSCDVIYFGIIRCSSEKRTKAINSIYEKQVKDKDEINIIRRGLLNFDNKDFQKIRKNYFDYYAPWGKFYKRTIIEENEIGFITTTPWAEDLVFNYTVLGKSVKIKYVDKIGYFYRVNQGSISYKYSPEIMDYYLNMISALKEIILEEKNSAFLQEFYLLVVRQFLFTAQRSVFHKEEQMTYFERKKYIISLCKNEIVKESLISADIKELRPSVKIAAFCLKHRFIAILDILYKIKRSIGG